MERIIQDLIDNFNTDNLSIFFRKKITNFTLDNTDYEFLFSNDTVITSKILETYRNFTKIGEFSTDTKEVVLVVSIEAKEPLSEKSSKLRQYHIAKKILNYEQADGGFFIFHDKNGHFRFSFVRQYNKGAKIELSSYKRFTYFVDKDNKTNKTFKKQISKADFSTMDSIENSFKVEEVTKEFYQKLQNWYFWAKQNVKFPEHAEQEKNGRDIAIIRLITRLMFIWFMKVRGLIPDKLFELEELDKLLADISPEQSTYYWAILQNLFFATLSTPQENRRFRKQKRFYKGWNEDYGNHYVYRYEKYFKISQDEIINLFKEIPFLNGGLFECLDDKTKDRENRRYIDGFTDLKSYRPIVPNFLFFAKSRKVDLKEFYGEKSKTKYEVEGLIEILKSYNFTIDENDPKDIEVALDPEMLGKIFENLLAAYNPETQESARKSSGSYYTPREIVNFMVTESLIQYFSTKMGKENDEDFKKKLSKILSDDENHVNPFDDETSKQIVNLIDQLRIVDPAVGSGAFPMAILSKLVSILKTIDPENRLWKQTQIEALRTSSISDPSLLHRLIEATEKKFKEKNSDYGRKLYLIEKCIYGVDIQEIAIEIAKLRFFISLLVDENIDPSLPNFGIEPLPNLEFKLMQGNSLKELKIIKNTDSDNFVIKGEGAITLQKLIQKYKSLKKEYLVCWDSKQKEKLKKDIEKIIFDILLEEKVNRYLPHLERIKEKAEFIKDQKTKEEYIKSETEQFYKKIGFNVEEIKKELNEYFNKNKAKDFFLWDIYFAEVFAEKGGFDIVIGNPPYIQLQKTFNNSKKFADIYKEEGFETFERTGDIYCLFYEKGIQLLSKNGILTYITSNKWMRAKYGEKLRNFLSRFTPIKLIDLGPGVFESATVDTNILVIKKQPGQKQPLKALTLQNKEQLTNHSSYLELKGLTSDSWIIASPIEQRIKEKIEEIGTPLKDWDIKINYGIKTGYNKAFIIDGKTKDELIEKDPKNAEIIKPLLRGRDIKRYKAEFADKWLIATFPALKIDINDYPIIKEYLSQFLPKIKQTGETFIDANGKKQKTRKKTGNKWFETQDQIAYYEEFEKEKIVWKALSKTPAFSYNTKIVYINDKANFLTSNSKKFNLKFLTAYFNSKLFFWQFSKLGINMGKGFEFKIQYVKKIPIPKIPESSQKPFEILADIILKKKEMGEDTEREEKIIDIMVYKLYRLTYEEVKAVDPEFSLSKEEYENFDIKNLNL